MAADATGLPVPENSTERVHEAIDRILARPEFAPESRSWVERARDEAFERLSRLLEAVFAADGGGAARWAAVVAVVGIAAVLAVRFARGVRPDPSVAEASPGGRRRPATDWSADAAVHERAGQWRDALRCRWRALVADLAGRGLVEEAPGRTAGEYRGQVAMAAPAMAPAFDAATALFEDAWYGHRPAGASQVEHLRALSAEVLEAAGSRS